MGRQKTDLRIGVSPVGAEEDDRSDEFLRDIFRRIERLDVGHLTFVAGKLGE